MAHRTGTNGPSMLAVLVAAVLLAVSAGCSADEDTAGTTTSSSVDPSTSSSTLISATTDQPTSSTAATASTSTSTTAPAAQTVEVFFSTGDGTDCGQVEGFERPVADTVDPVVAALNELVAGPTADEQAAGASSMFSPATADVIESTTRDRDLVIVDFVDLRTLIPNASTSCGSEALLAQLASTLFAFPAIERVRFRMGSSCDAFASWLQRECFELDRDGRSLPVPTNERASGSGCTPTSGDVLYDGRWFGYLEAPEAERLTFDLACWFTGLAADAAAAEDGEESPTPNDFYVRNASDRLRTIPVDPEAEMAVYLNPGDPQTLVVVDYTTWLDDQGSLDQETGVWLSITDGRIQSIEQQYVP